MAPPSLGAILGIFYPHESRMNQKSFAVRYMKPVFYFLRARGYPLHDAEDLTQAFFVHLTNRDAIPRADRSRGRFRNFLLTLLKNFLFDEKRRRGQRSFKQVSVPIESALSQHERMRNPPRHLAPD